MLFTIDGIYWIPLQAFNTDVMFISLLLLFFSIYSSFHLNYLYSNLNMISAMHRPNVLGIIEIIDTTLYFKVYNSQSKIANGLVHEWDCLHSRNHKKKQKYLKLNVVNARWFFASTLEWFSLCTKWEHVMNDENDLWRSSTKMFVNHLTS